MADVAASYDRDPKREWDRLERDAYHALEFALTMDTIQRHVTPGSRVLDAGGGPGRYAIALCREGHRVALCDLSPGNIALAKTRLADEQAETGQRFLSATVADVRDLACVPDQPYDAALCLGPLSHLPDLSDRQQALASLAATTKPGGLIFVSVSGHLAMLRRLACIGKAELGDEQVWELVQRGDSLVSGMHWHFFRADELCRLAEGANLETVDMLGCQSLSTGLPEATIRLAEDELAWKRWHDLLWRMAREPAVVDMAEHILYVGRVPII